MSDKWPKPVDSPTLPQVFDGEIYQAVGKYARSAVLFAFQQNGGPEGLAKWADENRDEFYTKLFPKIIARESEVKQTLTIDQLSDVIDADYEVEDAAVFDQTPNGQMQKIDQIAHNWNASDYDFENEEILATAAEPDFDPLDLVEVTE